MLVRHLSYFVTLARATEASNVAQPTLSAAIRKLEEDLEARLVIRGHTLFVGLVCNLFVRPVDGKHCMTDAELAREQALQHENRATINAATAARGGLPVWARLAVGVPFLIGLSIALTKAAALF